LVEYAIRVAWRGSTKTELHQELRCVATLIPKNDSFSPADRFPDACFFKQPGAATQKETHALCILCHLRKTTYLYTEILEQWGKEIADQDSQSRRINSTRKHGTHHLRGEILIDLLIRMSCEWIAFEPMKCNYNFGIDLVI
jgi:hypothetical protein